MASLRPFGPNHLGSSRLTGLAFALPMAYALAAAAFFVLRPFGHWSENDTVVLSDAIAWMSRTQQLVPTGGFVYPHGYAFQAVSTFLLAFTGLPISTLQQVLSPFVSALFVAPIAWVAYRELGPGLRVGTLATVLLLLEPEFLFVVLRGSHEKVSRALMLLALWALARTFRFQDRGHLTALMLLLYAASYGVIASNNLFATSFIVAIGTAFVLSWVFSRFWSGAARQSADVLTRRLIITTVCLIGLLVVFDVYIYPPASYEVNVYTEIWDKLTNLFHTTTNQQQPAGDPYAIVQTSWISSRAYFLVSIGNWLLLAGSFLFWFRDGFYWIVRRRGPPSQTAWFVWVLFGAFALQCAQAIVVDFAGALATNLQYRAFESFTLIAVVVFARGLTGVLSVPGRVRRFGPPVAAVVIGCLGIIGILKAANEPLLSNKWLFHTPAELQALRWFDANARNAGIWTEFDERLKSAYELSVTMDIAPTERELNGNHLDDYSVRPEDRDFLISDVTRARARRYEASPLPPGAQIRTYDNGSTQIYHLLRLSPYER
jgi:hypothetical protein